MAAGPREVIVNLIVGGGWATDFGEIVDVAPDQAGNLVIPFFPDAPDSLWTLDGGYRKMPGTAKLNAAALESGAAIKGIFDYWQGGATQHRVIFVGTKIKKDDADGAFTDLFTGLTADAVPCFCQLDDILIMANDVAGDVPKSWDGSTAQNLAGTPPSFSICAAHKNRAWAAGVAANPSRLYYSALLDPEDWVGAGSGSIDIDPQNGDEIRAIISHLNELWVFKGPNNGSIHRIAGSAPTGDDPFARKTFQEGVGAVGQSTVKPFANDVAFLWSDGAVRSLSATERFGDVLLGTMTVGINEDFLQPRLNFNRLKHAQMAVDTANSLILVGLPIDTAQDLNFHLAIDFRFQPARLSPIYDLPDGGSLARVIDPTDVNRRIIMLGGDDGFVRKWGRNDRSIDGSGAIAASVKYPFLNFGLPFHMKTVTDASISLRPRSSGNITLTYQREQEMTQSESVTQTAGAVLGEFLLGTDTLASNIATEKYLDNLSGEGRSIQFTVSNTVSGQDMDVRRLRVIIHIGAKSTE